jgi:hypothetical protein
MAGIAVLRRFRDLRICRQRIPGTSMASQAIAHAHGHVLINNIHRLYFAVAGLAKNSGVHMGPVIEIHVVRQRVNPLPLQRRPGSKDGGKFLNIPAFCLCHLVTVHTLFDGRNSRKPRFESAGVAIYARNFQNACVELVRVWDWLARPVSAHESIGLRIPAHNQNCGQHGHEADRQDESRIIQKGPT